MTPRTRMILAIVGSILVLILFFFFMIRPRQASLAEVRKEVEAEEARTTQLQAELARLQALQEQAPKLRAQLAELREFVPTNHEIPNFIFLVQAASNAAGVDFLRISPQLPQPPPEGASVAQISLDIDAKGGYFSIQDFIRRLYALDRAVRIDRFDLVGVPDEATGDITLTFTSALRIFFEPPAPPPAEVTPSPSPTGAAEEGG